MTVMLKGKRAGDACNTIYFRSDRVSRINGQYFFSTREGTMEGPYRSREEACIGINSYIERMTRPMHVRTGALAYRRGMTFSLHD